MTDGSRVFLFKCNQSSPQKVRKPGSSISKSLGTKGAGARGLGARGWSQSYLGRKKLFGGKREEKTSRGDLPRKGGGQ